MVTYKFEKTPIATGHVVHLRLNLVDRRHLNATRTDMACAHAFGSSRCVYLWVASEGGCSRKIGSLVGVVVVVAESRVSQNWRICECSASFDVLERNFPRIR